ncbi:MAG: hypothetical protein DI629_10390 [Mesorhizobium amorphae]|nr:MAG: hypothetical protein DI629_10390 [Mesorhizobium amorphae]
MLTERLAIAIGGYALCAGVGVLLDPRRFIIMLEALRERPASSYITGVAVYFLGAGILAAHFRWGNTLEAAVTLVGCAAVLEGAAFLVSPRFTVSAMRSFWRTSTMRGWGTISAAFGAAMIAAGLGII